MKSENTNNHTRRHCGRGPAIQAVYEGKNLINKLDPGSMSGMTAKKGFTLIELLVVVLIIGILSAIAIPQYQKAVEKSKATQALILLRNLADAQKTYYLTNGNYATSFDDLSVQIPWTGTSPWLSGLPTKSNQDWSVQLYRADAGKGISIGRLSGPYAGAGFMYILEARSGDVFDNKTNQIVCFERYYYGAVNFSKARGSYCQKLFPDFPFSYTN